LRGRGESVKEKLGKTDSPFWAEKKNCTVGDGKRLASIGRRVLGGMDGKRWEKFRGVDGDAKGGNSSSE